MSSLDEVKAEIFGDMPESIFGAAAYHTAKNQLEPLIEKAEGILNGQKEHPSIMPVLKAGFNIANNPALATFSLEEKKSAQDMADRYKARYEPIF